MEDVDFCARAKLRGWYFIIEPAAKLSHYPSQDSREEEYFSGKKEGANRREIFRILNPDAGLRLKIWFFWANLGWILRQLLTGHLRKSVGMTCGALGKNG